MAGTEDVVLQHGQAAGAVAGGTVELTAAAVADVASGVRNLPAVNKQSWIFVCTQRGAISHGQII